MTYPILQESCCDISDVNFEAVKNVRLRCCFLFCDVSDVVTALYSPFKSSLHSCYEYGEIKFSSKHNYL